MKQWFGLVILAIASWLATGLFFVQPDEVVLVRRCGRFLPGVYGPGAHLGFPQGIDRRTRVKPKEVKRVSVGRMSLAGEAAGDASLQLLTGDRNLASVHATVQYSIADPASYVRQQEVADQLVAKAAESGLARLLATRPIDLLLTQGKSEAATLARDELQVTLDGYGLGLTVRSVDLGALEPPADVAPAFADVVAAQRDREQQINQAYSHASRTLAQAQADAQRQVDQAHADSHRRVREATGEVERFEHMLAEYQRSPDLTARRMYWEAMAEILPRLQSKLLIDRGQQLDISVLGPAPK